MSTPSATTLVGQTIDGRYQVLAHLADGGMATVYVALDTRLDREVALKVMRRDLASDQAFVARFRREARAAARLSHPHVVGVYDQGQDGEHVFLAMELVRGRTLRQVIRSDAPLTARAALDIVEPVLEALGAAHRADTMHRDVKPENVIIGDDGVVKVADFGLARALTTETLTTNHDVLLGTAAYLSPEQVEHGLADKRSDVYAATLILHELLTGEKAYGGDTPIHVAYQHVHGAVPRPSDVVPSVAAELDELVALGAAKRPAQRPDDATEMLHELRRTRAVLDASDLDRTPDGQDPPEADAHLATETIGRGSRETTQLRRPPTDRAPVPGGGPGSPRGPRGPRKGGPAGRGGPGGGGPGGPGAGAALSGPAGRPGPGRTSGSGSSVAPAGSSDGRSRRGVLIGALLALLLVGGGTGWWFTLGPGSQVAVPDVAGLPQGEAIGTIDAAGLQAQVSEIFSETVPAGSVVRTEPAAGADQPRSESVVLRVSKGPQRFTVPEVVGATQQVATTRLREARLAVPTPTQEFSETVPAGTVIRSSPARGAQLKADSPVQLVVSKGRQPIAVPDVRGQTEDAARSVLTGTGLTVTTGPQEFSDTVPQGSVISQTPASGNLFRGQQVTLVISKGPEMVSVPSVLDMSTTQARQTLEGAGLKVKVNRIFGGLLDTVRNQDPTSGTSVRKGTEVTISVV